MKVRIFIEYIKDREKESTTIEISAPDFKDTDVEGLGLWTKEEQLSEWLFSTDIFLELLNKHDWDEIVDYHVCDEKEEDGKKIDGWLETFLSLLDEKTRIDVAVLYTANKELIDEMPTADLKCRTLSALHRTSQLAVGVSLGEIYKKATQDELE